MYCPDYGLNWNVMEKTKCISYRVFSLQDQQFSDVKDMLFIPPGLDRNIYVYRYVSSDEISYIY